MPPKKKSEPSEEDLRVVDGQNRGVVEKDFLYFCGNLGLPPNDSIVQVIQSKNSSYLSLLTVFLIGN
jgi:hypothetical protein